MRGGDEKLHGIEVLGEEPVVDRFGEAEEGGGETGMCLRLKKTGSCPRFIDRSHDRRPFYYIFSPYFPIRNTIKVWANGWLVESVPEPRVPPWLKSASQQHSIYDLGCKTNRVKDLQYLNFKPSILDTHAIR
jgi:hypothetical protein